MDVILFNPRQQVPGRVERADAGTGGRACEERQRIAAQREAGAELILFSPRRARVLREYSAGSLMG